MNQIDLSKLDTSRTAYVLLHEDKSHILGRPDGEPEYAYDQKTLQIVKKIAETELHQKGYHICELHRALRLIGEKQSELEGMWLPVIQRIRKAKAVNERIAIYRNFIQTKKQPHPLLYDKELKTLLKI